jgi:hypothetical protein
LSVTFFQNLKTTNRLSKAKIVFSDTAVLHLFRHVKQRDVSISGSNSRHAVIEGTRISPKFSVFCTLFKQYVFGVFCFVERVVTGVVYLSILEVISCQF